MRPRQVTDGFGGAIFGDKLRVNNATFAKNHASSQGGALFGGTDWVFNNSVRRGQWGASRSADRISQRYAR